MLQPRRIPSSPFIIVFAAIWGALEGSLLLWMFILSIWMVAVSFFSTHLPEAMRARIPRRDGIS